MIEQHTAKITTKVKKFKEYVCPHPYLQAVNVHGVQFGFITLFQDDALFHFCQMLLQIAFHILKAIEQKLKDALDYIKKY